MSNASIYHGSAGALYAGASSGSEALVANVTEWSVSHSREMVEITSLGDLARNYAPGLEIFEGTATIIMVDDGQTGFFDTKQDNDYSDETTPSRGTFAVGNSVFCKFYVDNQSADAAALFLSGTARISAIEYTYAAGEAFTANVTFTGTSPLTVDMQDA